MSTPTISIAKRADIKRLDTLKVKIDRAKARLAKDRDVLRALVQDVESVLETADNAVDAMESAKRSIEEAADELSCYL
jgi:hypothetical protein